VVQRKVNFLTIPTHRFKLTRPLRWTKGVNYG